jgi:hypothetical protein
VWSLVSTWLSVTVRMARMCRGKAPSCGVHSLFLPHDLVVIDEAVYMRDYVEGCHACDAFQDQEAIHAQA